MATLICQPCQNDDMTVEAVGYCVDCAEYLCVTCYKYHCKPQPCRHHVLLDADTMPRDAASHVQSDTCNKHKGKPLEYHCNSHDYVGCSVCMTLDHTTCEGKSYIPDIATAIPDSDEYKELQASVSDLINFADGQISVLNASMNDSEKYHDSIMEEVVQFREKLNDALDTLERVARDEAQILKERNAEKEKDKIKCCENIKDELERVNAELNMAIKYRQFMKLFIAMKSAKTTTSDLETRLKAVGSYEDIQFEFVPNTSILKLLNALETLGTVSAIRTDVVHTTSKQRRVRRVDSTSESLASDSDQSSTTSSKRHKTKSILKPPRVSAADSSHTNTKDVKDIKANAKTETRQQSDEATNQNLETTSVSVSVKDKVNLQTQETDNHVEESDMETREETVESSVKGRASIGLYMPSHSDDDDTEEPDANMKTADENTKQSVALSQTHIELGTKGADNESLKSKSESAQSDNETKVNENTKSSSDIEEANPTNNDKIVNNRVSRKNDIEEAKSATEPASNDNIVNERSSKSDTEEEKSKPSKPDIVPSSPVPITNPKDRVIVFLKDIDVTSSEDTTVPTISGMVSLDDDKIVVCDSENKSIKVVDVLTNIVVQTIKSDQSPWDVCEAGDDKIAVTFPYSKQITIYTLSESVKKDYTFNVGGGCYGIAYANDNLFVAFGDTNVIKVMDLYGYVVRVLENARGEKPIFNNPKHITAGPDGRLFYAANWGNDSVTCLTALGHVAGIFTDRDLKAPRGLAVDSFGLVYVCNYPRPSCIQLLTKGLNKVKKLLNKDKSIVNPLSLTYSAKGDWLFLGLKGETVKMFKLTV